MTGKQAKKLRRLSKMIAVGKPEVVQNKVYDRLKEVHTKTKGK